MYKYGSRIMASPPVVVLAIGAVNLGTEYMRVKSGRSFWERGKENRMVDYYCVCGFEVEVDSP